MIKKFFALFLLILAGSLIFFFLRIFSVKSVNCKVENNAECSPELQQALNSSLTGKSLFFSDFESVFAKEPFTTLPYTLNGYQKRLSGEFEVFFVKEPMHYLLSTSSGAKLAVGTAGTVISTGEAYDNLPVIFIGIPEEELVIERKIVNKVHAPLSALVESLYKHSIIFQNVTWHNANEITMDLADGQKVLLDANNPAFSIEKLSAIINSNEIEKIEEPIQVIDLRFEMPVLRTSE